MNPKAPSYSKVEFISLFLIYAFLCHGAYTEVATNSLIGCFAMLLSPSQTTYYNWCFLLQFLFLISCFHTPSHLIIVFVHCNEGHDITRAGGFWYCLPFCW